MEIFISIFGAITAIIVAIIGAVLSNKNSSMLQLRKLKEDHYISYIESLHNLASNNEEQDIRKYTYFRDKLLIVASEEVVKCILEYEEKGAGKPNEIHNKYLTNIVKSIRKDLKLKDKNFPNIHFRK